MYSICGDLRSIKDASNNYLKPESKLNGFVWNNITYGDTNGLGGAKEVAEHAYSSSYVQSGLITGRQWDTMLKFIEQTKNDDTNGNGVNTNSTLWGNYNNRTGYSFSIGYYKADANYNSSLYTNAASIQVNKTAYRDILMQTGAFGDITNEHPKNLYDVAGNVWEWTNEKVSEKGGDSTAVNNPVLRGGSFYSNGSGASASCRDGDGGAGTWYYSIGFRVVLYIL